MAWVRRSHGCHILPAHVPFGRQKVAIRFLYRAAETVRYSSKHDKEIARWPHKIKNIHAIDLSLKNLYGDIMELKKSNHASCHPYPSTRAQPCLLLLSCLCSKFQWKKISKILCRKVFSIQWNIIYFSGILVELCFYCDMAQIIFLRQFP